MVAAAVRLRAVSALSVAGLLVLPALRVLPPPSAAIISFLVAIALTLPSPVVGSAQRAKRAEG